MRTKIQTINDNARLNQWKLTIQECRSSGVSVRKWCQQNDVSEASYYYYLKKIRQSIIEEGADSQNFFPVVLEKQSKNDPELIEITKGDIHIQLPDDTDIDLLTNILKVLLC